MNDLPYVGLRPFQDSERIIFFGRELQIGELLNRLHETRLVAVLGSSGCGKSSLVRAGLLPRLQAGFLVEERDCWRIAILHPGLQPVAHLAGALQMALETPPLWPSELLEHVETEGTSSAADLIRQRVDESESNLLVVVDQFEELFRYSRSGLAAHQSENSKIFVDLLLRLSSTTRRQIYVVLTMRSDFLTDCDVFPFLPEALNRGQYLVPRLTREQRREAVEGPARLYGADITSRLLDTLLNDVNDAHDQLPLLQHCLARAWNRRTDPSKLDLPDYVRAGTIECALADEAEEALHEAKKWVTEAELGLIFRSLCDIDGRGRRVRRPRTLAELVDETTILGTQIENALLPFVDRTLLASSDRLYDLTHESLLREWPRLVVWTTTESESSDLLRRTYSDARKQLEDPSYTLGGPQLHNLAPWREAWNRNWAKRYLGEDEYDSILRFLRLCDKREEAERQRELDLQNRALEAERTRAYEFKKSAAKFQQLCGVLLCLLVAVIGLGAYLWTVSNRFQRLFLKSESHRLQALAQTTALDDKSGILLAATATELDRLAGPATNSVDADSNQLGDRALDFTRSRLFDRPDYWSEVMNGRGGPIVSTGVTRDGYVLTASQDKVVRVWEPGNPGSAPVELLHSDTVTACCISEDHEWVVTGTEHGTVTVWRVGNAKPVQIRTYTDKQTDAITMCSLSVNGDVATASRDGTALLFNLRDSREPDLLAHTNSVNTCVFSPNGQLLATTSDDYGVRLWSVRNPKRPAHLLAGHQKAVRVCAFSPTGNHLLTGDDGGIAILWDLDSTGIGRRHLTGHTADINSCAFSRNGEWAATASKDKTVLIWNVRDPSIYRVLASYEPHWALSCDFGRNDNLVAVGYGDTNIRVWDISDRNSWKAYPKFPDLDETASKSPPNWVLGGHTSYVGFCSFHCGDLVTASLDGTARKWDFSTARPAPVELTAGNDWVDSVAFCPGKNLLATASRDGQLKIFDLSNRGKRLTFTWQGKAGLCHCAFDRSGNFLATADSTGSILLWALDRLAEPPTLIGLQHEASTMCDFLPSTNGEPPIVVAASLQGLSLWETQTSHPQTPTLELPFQGTTSVAVSPDGGRLAAGNRNGTAQVWTRSAEGTYLPEFVLGRFGNGHSGWVNTCAFSSDGESLLTVSDDTTARLWQIGQKNVEKAQPKLLEKHTAWVTDCAFSADGNLIITASRDGTLQIWASKHLEKPPRQLKAQGWITACAISTNAGLVATGTANKVQLWDVKALTASKLHLSQVVYLATGRPFSDAEVKQFDLSQVKKLLPDYPLLSEVQRKH